VTAPIEASETGKGAATGSDPSAEGGAMTDDGTNAGLAIRIRGLTKRFGKIVALDALDLDIPRGIVFGLLGPNGAGKTTTIRLLTGLARPTAGSAAIDGIDVGSSGGVESRRRLGVLDQEPHFYGWMTGRELLAFVGDLLGLESAELDTRIDETLDQVGLTEAGDRRISGYSSGMRQRLGIGQAIIGRPDILILDEPVSSLDPEGRRDLLALIGNLRQSATVLFSTHVLSDVERVCDRVAILDAGRLVTEAPIEELLDQFAPPRYRLEAEPGQDARVEALAGGLRRQPWVTAADVDGAHLIVSVADDDRAATELLPIVAAVGLRILTFERERPTLEDAFLRLVGRDAAEPEAPEPEAPEPEALEPEAPATP
jgi:ABC-2 type transport system ATP-binding protein